MQVVQACAEVCLAKGWSSAVLLHEAGAGGAARLANAGVDIIPHQLPPPEDDALLR